MCNSTNSQSLGSTDCQFEDGSRYDVWSFSGTAGQTVTIEMTAVFDTFLALLDPSFPTQIVALDDDGGGGTNSRIVFTLDVTGSWLIIANSVLPNQLGSYTLSLACASGSAPPPPPTEACTAANVQTIACDSTTSQELTNADCSDRDGFFADFWSFSGTAGQTVTINMTATFDTILFLFHPSFPHLAVAADDDGGGGTNSQIVITLGTSGTWFIGASSFDSNVFGPYTLSVSCSSAPPPAACTPDATTLCLNNGRFRVTATFLTNAGLSGNGQAVSETTDTGMFWFFTANNIEAIIKVVNACTFDPPRYWVFAGGLTNVQVVLTVVDTLNGTTRTYTNPQNTAFQPIQDTNAFATCP